MIGLDKGMNKVLVIGGCGYIGSALVSLLRKQSGDCVSLDSHIFKCTGTNKCIDKNYNILTESDILSYDLIILLAGCSSVGMSSNYDITFRENVINFFNLVKILSKNQLLIYASSSSVYGVTDTAKETDKLVTPFNNYDFTKQTIDHIASFCDKNVVGLRFGTVSGFSENFRDDLIINGMTINALANKKITISNENSFRTVLDISDLCAGIYKMISNPDMIKHKIYNMGSYSGSIGDIGQQIQSLTDCTIINNDTFKSNYSFTVNCDLFKNTFDFEFLGNVKTIFEGIKNNFTDIKFFNKRIL